MDPATIRRFECEVVLTARLRHPNTVAVYDYGRTPDGVFYYAMEYLDGLTIGELVESEGRLPPERVVWLLAQVCASLDEAHSMRLIHRDIKPANIIVTGNTAAYDHVKVLDFGLVKSLARVDRRGSVTYMLAGQHVFEFSSNIELLAAHLHTAPQPLRERVGRGVPADLDALILRGLSKAPGDRPPSAAAFRDALLRCDVPAWTQEDARAWWRTRGARVRRRDIHAPDVAYPPTVTVVSERAMHG